ncbi:MAG: MBL fold metallo-hydrolase [Candidatus Omnitrophica bacterium]|nr:MBL fold metallo-hydrolase [Candidatus Omnitrophota bacterium]
MTNPDLYIKQMPIGPMENFVYFIGSKSKKEVVVVDCAWDVNAILKVAEKEGLKITAALVSHYHFDHTNGLSGLLKHLDIPVYINKEEAPWMKGLAASNTKAVGSGDSVKVGGIDIKCLHTPGHTPGSQCFHVDDALVSGDTLFINACGRTDLPGGDPKQLYESLTQKLSKLDDKTIVYPGHNYAAQTSSTIGDQKKSNPFMKFTSLQQFLSAFGY